MKKLITCMIFVSLFFASCGVLQDILGENQVLTTSSKVLKGHEDKASVIKTENLPTKAREFFNKKFPGETIVMVDADYVEEGAPRVPITQEGSSMWESVFSLAMKLGGQAFPPLLALEGIGLAFFKRKRNHYGNAVKALIPANGKIEVMPALASIGSALGMAHSSKATKDTFEEEKKAAV